MMKENLFYKRKNNIQKEKRGIFFFMRKFLKASLLPEQIKKKMD
jgi:hypothetical protein